MDHNDVTRDDDDVTGDDDDDDMTGDDDLFRQTLLNFTLKLMKKEEKPCKTTLEWNVC